MEQINLWTKIGNLCLELAYGLLSGDNASDVGTIERVEKLVGIAIAIDTNDFRWRNENRFFLESENELALKIANTINKAVNANLSD